MIPRVLITLPLALPLFACSTQDVPPAELVGTWEGPGRVVVAWCARDHVPIRLDIAPDGLVTGSVGDAALVDGRYFENRGAVGRALKIETDHLISGRLDGPLVREENITREAIDLPFDLKYGKLDGGFHSSGAKIGSAESMKFSGTFALDRR